MRFGVNRGFSILRSMPTPPPGRVLPGSGSAAVARFLEKTWIFAGMANRVHVLL